jgi:hypothetical protein
MTIERFRATSLFGPQSPDPHIRKRARKMLASAERLRRNAPELAARIDAMHAEMERTLIFGKQPDR